MRLRHVALGATACIALTVAVAGSLPVQAHSATGAIFTTLADGSEVNFNNYPSKDAVYLDGGPGPGAPQGAAGLDDGTYVFQVTSPSGRTLLSTDPARCRQFTVADGIITAVVVTGCEHATGDDIDHPPAKTVQLIPYNDTPNPGGVYKVWVTHLEDFPAACLDTVDCSVRGTKHGFDPGHTKTDNFKVGEQVVVEIDTVFRYHDGTVIDGLGVTWFDTVGGSNRKWSYYAPELLVNHEAHVEAVETGTHKITIEDQPGCFVHDVFLQGVDTGKDGPQTVSVQIKSLNKPLTVFIHVDCHTSEV
jgi:hypothetical protein